MNEPAQGSINDCHPNEWRASLAGDIGKEVKMVRVM
tara:strand:+ start:201 stop:308 length:108 start_codon:yes stop_codon:yes gene_type:complete